MAVLVLGLLFAAVALAAVARLEGARQTAALDRAGTGLQVLLLAGQSDAQARLQRIDPAGVALFYGEPAGWQFTHQYPDSGSYETRIERLDPSARRITVTATAGSQSRTQTRRYAAQPGRRFRTPLVAEQDVSLPAALALGMPTPAVGDLAFPSLTELRAVARQVIDIGPQADPVTGDFFIGGEGHAHGLAGGNTTDAQALDLSSPDRRILFLESSRPGVTVILDNLVYRGSGALITAPQVQVRWQRGATIRRQTGPAGEQSGLAVIALWQPEAGSPAEMQLDGGETAAAPTTFAGVLLYPGHLTLNGHLAVPGAVAARTIAGGSLQSLAAGGELRSSLLRRIPPVVPGAVEYWPVGP